jgi:hypothetical protein
MLFTFLLLKLLIKNFRILDKLNGTSNYVKINETIDGYLETIFFSFDSDSQVNNSIFIEIYPKYGPKTDKIFIKSISLTKTNMNYTIMPTNGYNGVTLFTLSAQTPFDNTQNHSLINKFVYYCKFILEFCFTLIFII